MATGRIGTTPALGFRWSESPAGGTTSLSGLDDNSVGLSYTPGNERVYRNGVLLSRGNDYTATSGNSITLIDATITGDIIEVFSQDLAQLTDAISKSSLTAKGTLLSASAASTLAVLGVGANDTVLTADSAETTGLKWATPAAGGAYTLLTTTNITTVATISITGINQTFKHLFVTMSDFTTNTTADSINCSLRTTANAAIGAQNVEIAFNGTSPLTAANLTGGSLVIAQDINSSVGAGANVNGTSFFIYNYAQTFQKSIVGSYGVFGVANGNYRAALFGGSTNAANGALAVHGLNFSTQSATNFRATGTIRIFGVN